MLFPTAEGEKGLEKAVGELVRDAVAREVKDGASIVILSDRGVGPELAPIPILLATAADHHHLIRLGIRTQCGHE